MDAATRQPGGGPQAGGAEPWPAKPPPVWPIVTVQFVTFLTIGIAIPILPFIWVYTPLARGDEIKGASLYSLSQTIDNVAQLLSASILGVLSDSVGRKPFLVLAGVGQVVLFAVSGLVTADRDDYALGLGHGHVFLFVAVSVSGLCGNMLVMSKAYVADVSTPQQSSTNFALIYVTIGIGFVMGPPIGALLSLEQFQLPMLMIAAMQLLGVCGTLFVRESLGGRDRVPVQWSRANPAGAVSFLLSSRFLLMFGVMSFVDQFALALLQVVFLQYMTIVFEVGRGLATSMLVVFGIGQAVVYVLVMPPLVKRRGEIFVLKAGYILTCFSYACMACLSYWRVFWLHAPVMVCMALGAMSVPTEAAIATRCVGEGEQGRLQGADGCLDVVGRILGSFAVYLIFEPSARVGQPGTIWWFACMVELIGVWAAFRLEHVLPARYFQAPPGARASVADSSATDHAAGEIKRNACEEKACDHAISVLCADDIVIETCAAGVIERDASAGVSRCAHDFPPSGRLRPSKCFELLWCS